MPTVANLRGSEACPLKYNQYDYFSKRIYSSIETISTVEKKTPIGPYWASVERYVMQSINIEVVRDFKPDC